VEKAGIIEKAQTLLEVKGLKIPASALDIFYDECHQYILNYCNLHKLPEELESTLIRLIINQCIINGNVANSVNSISEGGRTVSFSNSLDIAKFVDNDIKTILNKFKVLYK
jgi:hypothetical protein